MLSGTEPHLEVEVVSLSGPCGLLDLGQLNGDVSKVLCDFSSWPLNSDDSLSYGNSD